MARQYQSQNNRCRTNECLSATRQQEKNTLTKRSFTVFATEQQFMKSSHIPQLPELPEQEAPHFAALDLGSNSFHLITARLVNHDLQAVQKFKQKVGLG